MVLKETWQSLLAVEGSVIILEASGLRNPRMVMSFSEHCAVTVALIPFRERGCKGFRFPRDVRQFTWDPHIGLEINSLLLFLLLLLASHPGESSVANVAG